MEKKVSVEPVHSTKNSIVEQAPTKSASHNTSHHARNLQLPPKHRRARDVEVKVAEGKEIISNLSDQFKTKNNGRFIAVTFTRKVLAVCDTLEALNREVAKKGLTENYYIGRLGYDEIAQI